MTGEVQWEDPGSTPYEDENGGRYWIGPDGERMQLAIEVLACIGAWQPSTTSSLTLLAKLNILGWHIKPSLPVHLQDSGIDELAEYMGAPTQDLLQYVWIEQYSEELKR